MIVLEFIYSILGTIYYNTTILITSVILNIYYLIKLTCQNKLKIGKEKMFYYANKVTSQQKLIHYEDVLTYVYKYDLLFGLISWVSPALITFARWKTWHSKDCKKHAGILKWLIHNTEYGKKYKKTKITYYLSIKPFIIQSHSIVLAYYDNKIDAYSPYDFYKTYDIKDKKHIYKDISKMLEDEKPTTYCRFPILNLF